MIKTLQDYYAQLIALLRIKASGNHFVRIQWNTAIVILDEIYNMLNKRLNVLILEAQTEIYLK